MLEERIFALDYCAHQILLSFCGQHTVGFWDPGILLKLYHKLQKYTYLLEDMRISGIQCENLQPLLWRWWGTVTSAY